jgi:hypothetical protein
MRYQDNISALLGTGQDPREQQLAQALRGQQAGGDMLGLSTIGSVSNLGQNINARTNAAAKQGGQLKQAMQAAEAKRIEAETARAFTSEQEGLNRAATKANSLASDDRLDIRQQKERDWRGEEAEMDRKENIRHNQITEGLTSRGMDLREANDLAELDYLYYKTDEQTKIDRAKLLAEAKENAQWTKEGGVKGMTPNEKQQNAYAMAVNTNKVMGDMGKFIETMDEEQMNQADKVIAPMVTAIGTLGNDAAQRYIAENITHTDPNVRRYLTQGAKIENEFSRAMSGLAVTVFENSLRENWSPFVKGISQAERLRRMQDMGHELEKAQAAHEAVFGTKFRVVGEAINATENKNPLVGAKDPNDISNMSIEALNRIATGKVE